MPAQDTGTGGSSPGTSSGTLPPSLVLATPTTGGGAAATPAGQYAAYLNSLASANTLSTSPPAYPKTGDIWTTEVGTTGTLWSFRYNASSSSSYKWEFIGGSQLCFSLLTAPTWALSTWTAFPSMSYTAARAGEYIVHGGYAGVGNGTSAATYEVGISVGGVTPPGVIFGTATASASVQFHSTVPPAVYVAAVNNAITLDYFLNAAPTGSVYQIMTIVPRRVS